MSHQWLLIMSYLASSKSILEQLLIPYSLWTMVSNPVHMVRNHLQVDQSAVFVKYESADRRAELAFRKRNRFLILSVKICLGSNMKNWLFDRAFIFSQNIFTGRLLLFTITFNQLDSSNALISSNQRTLTDFICQSLNGIDQSSGDGPSVGTSPWVVSTMSESLTSTLSRPSSSTVFQSVLLKWSYRT